MRKTIVLILAFVIISCNSKLDDIEYRARVGLSCAKTSTGGFMIYDSCRLYFRNDSVTVHYYQIDTDNPNILKENKIEKHKYIFEENVLNIKNFKYGKLSYKNNFFFTMYRVGDNDTLKFYKK